MKNSRLGRRFGWIFALLPVLFLSSNSLLTSLPARADESEVTAGSSTPWSARDLLPEKDKFDPSREIRELRTESSKIYDNGDGTRTVVTSMGGPAHYQDPASGEWRDIKETVNPHGQAPLSARHNPATGAAAQPPGQEIYELANEENVLRSYFKGRSGAGHLMRVERNDQAITWQPAVMKWVDETGAEEIISVAADRAARADGSRVVYEDLFPLVDEEFEVTTGRIKDNVYLYLPPSPPLISGLGAVLVIEGTLTVSEGLAVFADGVEMDGWFATFSEIELRDAAGDMVAMIEGPRVYDQAGARTAEAYYTWDPRAGGLNFTMEIPAAWVLDPGREYPVVIDPTVTRQLIYDTFISSACPENNYGTRDQIWIGYDEGIDPCWYIDSLVDWHTMYGLVYSYPGSATASPVPSCIPSANITSATLNLYIGGVAGTSPAVRPDRITQTWSETGTTWNNAPNHTNDGDVAQNPGSASGWYGFPVTNIARSWHNGNSMYGFYLYQSTFSSGNNYITFWSYEHQQSCSPTQLGYCRPYLSVDYTDQCTPSSTCCNASGCYIASGTACSTTDSCSADDLCAGYACNGAGACANQTGCVDCGDKDCDTLDVTCRNYADMNRNCVSAACDDPACTSWTDAPTSTSCSTLECDQNDVTCRNFHDVTGYCNGGGGCTTPTVCSDWTDAPTTTVCDTHDCDYLDNTCANWHDNQGTCLAGSCTPASTTCAAYDYNGGYTDGTYCGNVDCSAWNTPCRTFTNGFNICQDGSCVPWFCTAYVDAPAGTACSTCGICDGSGSCVPSSNETECGTCAFCNGAGACSVVPPDDSACGTVDCDSFDSVCRDYQDLTQNRCEGLLNCKDPNTADCNVYVNKSTTAPCGTVDCDYLDTECSNYQDAIQYCNGVGGCLSATCAPPTFMAPGTVCATCGGPAGCLCNGSGTCAPIIPCSLDAECGDGNVCTDDVCVAPGTPSSYCSNVPNAVTCGTRNCDASDRDCRDYLEANLTCAGAACQDPGCASYVDAAAGTTCDDNGGQVCDGAGTCVGCVDALDCDDGRPCTEDGCTASGCAHDNLPNGAECPGGACDPLGACVAGAIPAGTGGGGGDAGCGCMVLPGRPRSDYWLAGALYSVPLLITLVLRKSAKRGPQKNKHLK